MRKIIKYMHTIGGRAGSYDGRQVCYAIRTRPIRLCGSLESLRAEQRSSNKWRKGQGFSARVDFGHLRVAVSEASKLSTNQAVNRLVRCEECRAQKTLIPLLWPTGWSQSGRSRFGRTYQKSGIAWHCPKHSRRA